MDPKKVVFLDRDGTINVDHGYVGSIAQWEFIPGVIEALKQLQQAGFALTIITNQGGIGMGYYTLDDMNAVHEHMATELGKVGVTLAMIAYCPHHPDDEACDCRKPKTGMAKQIEAKIGPIDYANSWTIGDKEADMKFGKTIGTKTALIHSLYWSMDQLTDQPDLMVDSLSQAVTSIIKV